MYVTVSLKIELAATASLPDLERQIQAAGREAMQDALKQAIRQSEAQQQVCPACGSTRQRSHGTKRRILLTSFGRVEVRLQRRRCQQCGQWFRPADACLADVRGHNIAHVMRNEHVEEVAADLMGENGAKRNAARRGGGKTS